MHVEVVADQACDLGESPLWHSTEQQLYWTDMYNGNVFRYNPDTETDEQVYEGSYIGGFTFQEDGNLLLFQKDGQVSVLDDGEIVTECEYELPAEDDGVFFNDVIADPEGRVYCGTRYEDDRTGSLYRLGTDGELTRIDDGIGISNGFGFTRDHEYLFFTDSGGFKGERNREIAVYKYDQETGALSNRQTFVNVPTDEGLPDGMTVDAENYVWSAHAFDHTVLRYTPDGTVDRQVEFPVGLVTSVTFGDTDYGSLYVTSGGGENKEKYGDDAGALFRVTSDVSGVEELRSRINL